MRAGDSFTIANKGKTSFDSEAFTLLYLPIIGRDAFALYQLMLNFSTGRISHFLEYLDFGMDPFTDALNKLTGLDLVQLYEEHSSFYFEVKSPLNFEAFLADDFYRQLLVSRIGENRVNGLSKTISPKGKNISKKFHEVYSVRFEPKIAETAHQTTEKFNMGAFEYAMRDVGLAFADEAHDKLTLYSMAEKFDLSWFQLFKLAEETAINQVLSMIQLEAKIAGTSQPLPLMKDFSKAESDLILVAKEIANALTKEERDNQITPSDKFLTQIKKNSNGFPSNDERRLLTTLTLQQIPYEVQNILIHYLLVQQQKPSLSEIDVNRLANDWKRNKIMTAEQAVKRIQERKTKRAENAKNRAAQFSKPIFSQQKIVKEAPKWSNPDYVEKTSDEEKARFAALQQQMQKEIQQENQQGGNEK